MHTHHRTGLSACLALAALAGLSPASQAEAAEVRAVSISPVANCEAPLPVFNATLRKRPVAIANEGASRIFVSCTLMSDTMGQDKGSITVSFASNGPSGRVDCTLVAGGTITQDYLAGSVDVPAGGRARLYWDQVSKRNPAGSYAFSCVLPPDLEMSTITFAQFDNDNLL